MKSHKKRKSSKFNPVKQIKKAKHEYCFLHYCIVLLKMALCRYSKSDDEEKCEHFEITLCF